METSQRRKVGGFLFIAFFCTLIIVLSSFPLGARTKGLLEENMNKEPYKIDIGWREGCLSKEECARGTRELSDIFSNSAWRDGLGVFAMLVVTVAASAVIFIAGALGVCYKAPLVNQLGVAATATGLIFGILLLFIAPKFRNAVLGQVKMITREHFDIACGDDAQVICRSTPDPFGCTGEYSVPVNTTINCRYQELDIVCENVDDTDKPLMTNCVVSKFTRQCSEVKAVCNLHSQDAYRLILVQGVCWLLLGMFVMAVFVGRGVHAPVSAYK